MSTFSKYLHSFIKALILLICILANVACWTRKINEFKLDVICSWYSVEYIFKYILYHNIHFHEFFITLFLRYGLCLPGKKVWENSKIIESAHKCSNSFEELSLDGEVHIHKVLKLEVIEAFKVSMKILLHCSPIRHIRSQL